MALQVEEMSLSQQVSACVVCSGYVFDVLWPASAAVACAAVTASERLSATTVPAEATTAFHSHDKH
jgi:hypothetical protein